MPDTMTPQLWIQELVQSIQKPETITSPETTWKPPTDEEMGLVTSTVAPPVINWGAPAVYNSPWGTPVTNQPAASTVQIGTPQYQPLGNQTVLQQWLAQNGYPATPLGPAAPPFQPNYGIGSVGVTPLPYATSPAGWQTPPTDITQPPQVTSYQPPTETAPPVTPGRGTPENPYNPPAAATPNLNPSPWSLQNTGGPGGASQYQYGEWLAPNKEDWSKVPSYAAMISAGYVWDVNKGAWVLAKKPGLGGYTARGGGGGGGAFAPSTNLPSWYMNLVNWNYKS